MRVIAGLIFLGILAVGQTQTARTCGIDTGGVTRWDIYQLTLSGTTVFEFKSTGATNVTIKDGTFPSLKPEDFQVVFNPATEEGEFKLISDVIGKLGDGTNFLRFYLECQVDGVIAGTSPELTIILKDSNLKPPVFEAQEYSFDVPENFPVDFDLTKLGTAIRTSDEDDSPVNRKATFEFIGDNLALANEYFKIESVFDGVRTNTAIVKLRKALNYDVFTNIALQIEAKNPSDPNDPNAGDPLTATTSVTIKVFDSFDTILDFKSQAYTIYMNNPDIVAGTEIVPMEGAIEVSNAMPEHGQVTFRGRGSSGTADKFFEIKENGAVVFKGATFLDLVEDISGGLSTLVMIIEAVPDTNPLLRGTTVLIIDVDKFANGTTAEVTSVTPGIPSTEASSQGTTATHQQTHTAAQTASTAVSDASADFDDKYTFTSLAVGAGQPVFLIQANSNVPQWLIYSLEDEEKFKIDKATGLVSTRQNLEPDTNFILKVSVEIQGDASSKKSTEAHLTVQAIASSILKSRAYNAKIDESKLVDGLVLYDFAAPDADLSIVALEFSEEACKHPNSSNPFRLADGKIQFAWEKGQLLWHKCPGGIRAKIRENISGTQPPENDDMSEVALNEAIFWLEILDVNDHEPTVTSSGSNIGTSKPATVGYFSKDVAWPIAYPPVVDLKVTDSVDSPDQLRIQMRIANDMGDFFLASTSKDLNSESWSLMPMRGLQCSDVCEVKLEYTDDGERWTSMALQVALLGAENLATIRYRAPELTTPADVVKFLQGHSTNPSFKYGVLTAKNDGTTSFLFRETIYDVNAVAYALIDGDSLKPATAAELKNALNLPNGDVEDFDVTAVLHDCDFKTVRQQNDAGKIAAIVLGAILGCVLVAFAAQLYRKRNSRKTGQKHPAIIHHKDSVLVSRRNSKEGNSSLKSGEEPKTTEAINEGYSDAPDIIVHSPQDHQVKIAETAMESPDVQQGPTIVDNDEESRDDLVEDELNESPRRDSKEKRKVAFALPEVDVTPPPDAEPPADDYEDTTL